MNFLPFSTELTTLKADSTSLGAAGIEKTTPKDLDIFFRPESDFLPEGKGFDDLNETERTELRNKYRFSPYRPGIYYGIQWNGDIRIGRTKHGIL